jgi:hypothetical protein
MQAKPENMSEDQTTMSKHEQALLVLQEIASIKEQLAHAKAAAAKTGFYSDNNWFQSATRALKHKQIQHQRLLHEISQEKRAIKALAAVKQKNFYEIFVEVAKEVLDQETFLSIRVEAQRRAGQGN